MFGLGPRLLAIVASVSWMAVSSALILLNKKLLSNGFPYPMALSGMGMVFSALASFLCCRVFRIVAADKEVTWRFYLTRIMPVGLCMASALHFGNLVYLYLTVSFIQMLKASSPVLTMLGLFLAGLQQPSARLVVSVLVIAAGTAVASYGESHFNATGLLIMMLNECSEATRMVMTELLLVGLRFHPIEGLMYLAPACVFWLAIGCSILEVPRMRAEGALGVLQSHPLEFMAAGAMGFLTNALAYVVIHTVSSLTLKVLGTAKNGIVVVIGIVLLGDEVGALQALGYGIALAALFWYNSIKMSEMAAGASSSGGSGGGGGGERKGDKDSGGDEWGGRAAGEGEPLIKHAPAAKDIPVISLSAVQREQWPGKNGRH